MQQSSQGPQHKALLAGQERAAREAAAMGREWNAGARSALSAQRAARGWVCLACQKLPAAWCEKLPAARSVRSVQRGHSQAGGLRGFGSNVSLHLHISTLLWNLSRQQARHTHKTCCAPPTNPAAAHLTLPLLGSRPRPRRMPRPRPQSSSPGLPPCKGRRRCSRPLRLSYQARSPRCFKWRYGGMCPQPQGTGKAQQRVLAIPPNILLLCAGPHPAQTGTKPP